MNTSASTSTLLSFSQWLDNRILQKGASYTNATSRLYYRADSRLGPGYVTYQAPFKSLVYDSGVSGATIMNSVSGSFGTINRGTSGMMVDYENGRVIFPAAFGSTNIISGSYAFKDFNVYFANQSQEGSIFTNKYYLNGRFNRSVSSPPPAYDLVTPCVFISNRGMTNEERGIGGVRETSMNVRLIIASETLYQLENVASLLCDSKHDIFPVLDRSLSPLNFYGDYKSGYNYEQIKAQYGGSSDSIEIAKVQSFKMSDTVKANESIFFGGVDFTLKRVRDLT